MLYRNADSSVILNHSEDMITVIKGGNLWADGYTFKHYTRLPEGWMPCSFNDHLNRLKDVV